MYFVARTGALLAGERLYVDSCHSTSYKDPDSTPRLDIISNYGCVSSSTVLAELAHQFAS